MSNHAHVFDINTNSKLIFVCPTCINEIVNIVRKRKENAGGVDGNNVKVLKRIMCICDPLEYIFNLSIEKSTWPLPLKKAEIIQIFKSGKRHLTTNYRPISLISNLAKIFE